MLKLRVNRNSRLWRDEDGSISIEFILVLPILVLWLLGSFVFFDAFRSFSQTEKLAYTVTDIMSRHDSVDDTDIDYLRALQLKMHPPRSTNNWIRVSSICYLDGDYKVLWSTVRQDSGLNLQPLDDAAVPLEIMPVMVNHDTIILAELSGRWTPLSTKVGARARDFINRLVVRPRYVKAVPHEDINLATLCPSGSSGGSTTGGSGGSGGSGGELASTNSSNGSGGTAAATGGF